MELDVDRLCAAKRTRQSGRTTDMLVAAAQQADFMDGGEVVIFVPFRHQFRYYADMFCEVAWALGFAIDRRTESEVWIGQCCYSFVTPDTSLRGRCPLVWVDHSVYELGLTISEENNVLLS